MNIVTIFTVCAGGQNAACTGASAQRVSCTMQSESERERERERKRERERARERASEREGETQTDGEADRGERTIVTKEHGAG